jgi:hypothetical protein
MTDELSQLRAISEGQIRMYDKVIIFAAFCLGFACGAFAGMVLL